MFQREVPHLLLWIIDAMPTSYANPHPDPAVSVHEIDGTSEAKRRKIRKGTRSCWECRRRKMKCIFSSPADKACFHCHRRGVKCVGQDHPEEITPSLDRSVQMADRIVRVEALVEQLLKKVPNDSAPASVQAAREYDVETHHGIFAPALVSSEPSQVLAVESETSGFEPTDGGTGSSKPESVKAPFLRPANYGRLSLALHEPLLSPEDIRIIFTACGNTSSFFYQTQTVPYNSLDKKKCLKSMFTRPEPNVHPVLIARHMLHAATALQHLHPDLYEEMKGLSVPPREMMRRLADIAINILTTNDNIIRCIEGLDCMMIKSWYHANGGNLWKGLVAIRTAMTIAQLMGFHRPGRAQCKVVERDTEAYPELVWFRIVSIERYLCLMLDVPQGTHDRTMASESMLASDTPMGRLDRIHCVITSRILERNQSDPNSHDFALTQGLDEVLQSASGGLPPRWWLTPNLATAMSQPEALFWDMRRLFHHLYHYNILIQLHLPYMLRSSATGEIYDYSRSTCVNASREILSRLVMFHSFNRVAFCCRTVDFFGLMAAMTLLIAHIDEHRRRPPSLTLPQRSWNHTVSRDNLLAHQRPCDHALIEKVLESIEEVSRLEGDAMSVQNSGLLRRLMAIEAEAADETLHYNGVQVPVTEEGPYPPDSSDTIRVSISYFGVIEIGRKGIYPVAADTSQPQYQIAEGPCANGVYLQAAADSTGSGMSSMNPNAGDKIPTYTTQKYREGFSTETEAQPLGLPAQLLTINHNNPATHGPLQSHTALSDAVPQQYDEPLYAAGFDGWALQDADIAFFDTVMRMTRNDGDDGTDCSAWSNQSQFPNAD
ncbi:hypothetical protein N7486_003567 [Penicillium sp. IBT 16267x]|nr:hypothetical protein N7486_003567 [Penicillium sp. IBT 16267x]